MDLRTNLPRACLVVCGAALAACGSTTVDGTTTAAATTTSSSTATTTGTGAGGGTTTTTGAGGATTTTTTTTTSGTTTPCGDLTCAPGEACVVVERPAACSQAPEDGGACPEGTTLTECGGGAGFWPCCCAPPPPLEHSCAAAGSCEGDPTCECVGLKCPDDLMCMAYGGDPPSLRCVDPPKP